MDTRILCRSLFLRERGEGVMMMMICMFGLGGMEWNGKISGMKYILFCFIVRLNGIFVVRLWVFLYEVLVVKGRWVVYTRITQVKRPEENTVHG
jgi:hypothetical protein